MPSLGVFSLSRPSTRGMWSSYKLSLHSNKFSTSRSHVRFRQVPTFGGDVIRKFANNTSEMKKLAARDFEDILQVNFVVKFMLRLTDIPSSVLFQFLKGFSLPTTMQPCSLCYIGLQSGMHLLNSGCTQILPWLFWKKHLKHSPGSCKSFGPTRALLSTLWSYQKRERLIKEGLSSVLKLTMSLQNPRGPK